MRITKEYFRIVLRELRSLANRTRNAEEQMAAAQTRRDVLRAQLETRFEEPWLLAGGEGAPPLDALLRASPDAFPRDEAALRRLAAGE